MTQTTSRASPPPCGLREKQSRPIAGALFNMKKLGAPGESSQPPSILLQLHGFEVEMRRELTAVSNMTC